MHKVCLVCEHVARPRLFTPGHMGIELGLWGMGVVLIPFGIGCFLLPVAVIYSIWRVAARKLRCSQCGSESIVPIDSPAGQRVIDASARASAEQA